MKKIFFNTNSISLKSITPSAIIFFFIVILTAIFLNYYTKSITFKSAMRHASEIAETFNLSLEADASLANLIRTTNSIGTFNDINSLYIIDSSRKNILASSNNIYSRKPLNQVNNEYLLKILNHAIKTKGNDFYINNSGNYIYVYHFIINSTDSLKFDKQILIIDANADTLTSMFSTQQYILQFVFLLSIFASMWAYFFRINSIVIKPIMSLLRSIHKSNELDSPVRFEYRSDDEIGELVGSYNRMIETEYSRLNELTKAKEESESASKAKSQFLSTMSHEIRTPMNGVIGGCAFLEETQLSEEQKRHTSMIKHSSQQLLSLVNDILDFSKIESGKLELDKQAINLTNIIDQVINIFQQDIETKKISLEFITPPNILPNLLGDETRLKQILINILSNAIKFTHTGGITISIDSINTRNRHFDFTIKITDTGIGIEKKIAGKLFNSFTQADTSTTRKFGGTGLGLAICKQLTELMNGEIWFTSEVEKGTTFYIKLCLETTQEVIGENKDDIIENTRVFNKSANILLVEDTLVNQLIARSVLEGAGHDVSVSNNGDEAVKAAKLKQYDLILMDCFMPVMDGFDATRLIRENELHNNKPNVPVIAVTADASDDNKKKCSDSGMDDYLLKPYEPHVLLNKLYKYLN